jgi:NAD(P)-dependent dehydrogenase (short-subunit alcohol dehydrogenase family)
MSRSTDEQAGKEASQLDGRIVLITGAARRVGRALAIRVAQAGGTVILHHGHSPQEAEAVRDEIESIGGQAHILQADLSDPFQTARVIPHARELGPLFALVNNAAIFEPLTLETTTLSDWERHLVTNLTAPFLLSQAFAASLPMNQTGRIVNLLDWRAFRPGADHLPYTVSKAALAALTKSLAVALAPRITVNGLALGAILPPSDGTPAEAILANTPAGRWANLDEVGQVLLFLLTGPAYITGEVIHLDGGRHLV